MGTPGGLPYFADDARMGFPPYRDHRTDVPLLHRDVPKGFRSLGFEEDGLDAGQRSATDPGDFNCWAFWPAEETPASGEGAAAQGTGGAASHLGGGGQRNASAASGNTGADDERQFGSVFNAFAAIVTDDEGKLRPLHKQGVRADDRYRALEWVDTGQALPLAGGQFASEITPDGAVDPEDELFYADAARMGWPLPADTTGIVVPATEEHAQHLVFMPSWQNTLIAHHDGRPNGLAWPGSVRSSVNPQGNFPGGATAAASLVQAWSDVRPYSTRISDREPDRRSDPERLPAAASPSARRRSGPCAAIRSSRPR